MKKLLFIIFILFNSNLFAWGIGNVVNEFNEPTGKKVIKGYDKNGSSVTIYEDHFIIFNSKYYIGEKSNYQSSKIRVKIDDNSPITLEGNVASFNPHIISLFQTEGSYLTRRMLGGKLMKVSIEKYSGETILLEFDLEDFENVYNKLHRGY